LDAAIAPIILPASSTKVKMANDNQLELTPEHATLLADKRKISAATAKRLGIVSRGNVIGFQYRQDGMLKWTKYRGSGKKFWIEPAGERLIPWNLDCFRNFPSSGPKTLILTEGEFDAAAVVEAGFHHVMSVPNGATPAKTEGVEGGDIRPLEDRQFAYLWTPDGRLLPELADAQKIILAGDNDVPGKALIAELAIRLGQDRCALAVWPTGCKDANDVLVKHGVEALQAALAKPVDLVPDKLVAWSDLPEIEQAPGLKSGWRDLDPHLKLTFPELIIVTGKPNAGKSRWTLNWVMNLARLYGIRATYVSFEDGAERLRRHTLTYARTWEGVEMTTEDGEILMPIEKGGVRKWLDNSLRFVAPSVSEEDTRDMEWLKRIIWEAACRHDCKIVVFDPWNEIEHMWSKSFGSETEYLNAAIRELKRWARRYGLVLIILAHPDKHAGRNETIEEMTLYSISGGATWKNKADGGIVIGQELNSDGPTGNSIVKVDKRKDWDTQGSPGTVVLSFDAVKGIYISR
jgi:twinkle protein